MQFNKSKSRISSLALSRATSLMTILGMGGGARTPKCSLIMVTKCQIRDGLGKKSHKRGNSKKTLSQGAVKTGRGGSKLLLLQSKIKFE